MHRKKKENIKGYRAIEPWGFKRRRQMEMKKVFGLVLSVFLILPVFAQERTGNIYGIVVDADGMALPGVSVTLTGSLTAPMTTMTSAEGRFRFMFLSPARDYSLRAELPGFRIKHEEGIIVRVGANVEISLAMEVGSIEEEVTVTAATPVIDTKRTTVSATIDKEALQSLPTARDPWVVIQMQAAVQMDRENIGGSESGQQASFTAHGSRSGSQDVWSVDGAVITDVSSTGSAIYYDFD